MNKSFLLLTLALFVVLLAPAQSLRGLDKSPLDVAYFPDNFAHDRKDGEVAIVKITYSRPQKNGREIFGEKVPYGKVWRTGANEATEIKVYQKITLGGAKLKKGTYSLFTVPGEKEWEIIISKDLDYWGAYSYKPENDLLRLTVPARTTDEVVEAFTIQLKADGDNQALLILAWDQTRVEVPVGY
jgi:hypothetical protein